MVFVAVGLLNRECQMKSIAVIAVAAVGLATGCADNAASGTRAPASSATKPAVPASVTTRASATDAASQTPAVEAPKPSVMPVGANSAGSRGTVIIDRDPPDRIQVSR
jgi:hypothetical protein